MYVLQVYSAAVIFYEPFPSESITPELKEQLGLDDEKNSNKSVHVNKCICLLSRWPFFDTFKKFLSYLYHMPSAGPHLVPIERLVALMEKGKYRKILLHSNCVKGIVHL